MADYYSVEYAKVINTSPPTQIDSGMWGGRLHHMEAYYTVPAGGIASGSVLYAFRPPKGARFMYGTITNSADLTNNTTLQCGILGATDKFMAATNHGGGAAVRTAFPAAAKAAAIGYEFDGATDFIVTTGTGTAAAAAIISIECLFKMPG